MGRARPRRRPPALDAVPADRSRHRGVGLTASSWLVTRRAGDPVELLARPLPTDAGRRVEFVVTTRRAVVLGSTQRDDVIDADRATAAGAAVVRRRSGGGAVWLDGDDEVWADVWITTADALWDDDVGRAFHWLGDAWCRALAALGVDVSWHDGPLVRTTWSDVVCFAGTGPGEVVAPSGAKVVGMAQRRTHHGALFQCAVLRRWDPKPLVDVLALDERRRADAVAALAGVGAPVGAAVADIEAALVEALPA